VHDLAMASDKVGGVHSLMIDLVSSQRPVLCVRFEGVLDGR